MYKNLDQSTNAKVQKLNNVSQATANKYLSELEDEYLEKTGTTGVGTHYRLKVPSMGS